MQNTGKKFLILPAMPTPNGGLHLGHLGGPYLSADILRRYLLVCGHQVVMLSGIDCYESFVESQAELEKKSNVDLCHDNYQLLVNDLKAMQIDMDLFINPLDKKYHARFSNWHYQLFDKLVASSALQPQKETVAWDAANSRYHAGCWLTGNCPDCHAKITGYFCDECGGYFRPEQIIQKNLVDTHEVENLFLPLPFVFKLMNKGLNAEIQKRYIHFIKSQLALVRITTKTNWGLHYKSYTLFSYSFLFAYYLFLADLSRQFFNTEYNPLSVDSDVTVIASFGIDNALPVLTSVLGMSQHSHEYRPIDFYLVNYFYHLNHSKFSTSRRYAIWVNDLINHHHANSDIVRLYLAGINVRDKHNNFSSQEFIFEYNATVTWIQQFIVKPMTALQQPNVACSDLLLLKFKDCFEALKHGMQIHDFRPHLSVGAINKWLSIHDEINQAEYFWWLKFLAILIYPFMPKLSQSLWTALGYAATPQNNRLQDLPVNSLSHDISVPLNFISDEELQACINGVLNEAS